MQTNPIETLPDTEVITAMQARQQFGEIMDRAVYQGRNVIVERAGKLTVAIVPVEAYQRYVEREAAARETFFAMTEELREKFGDLSEAEAMTLANEAVAEVRAERPEAQRKSL